VTRRAPAGKVNRTTRANASARSAPARQPDVLPKLDRWLWLVWPGLLAATALAYFPVWHGGMLWDDDGHMTPPDLRPLAGLWRIWFVIGATQQYYPLTHSVFWVLHRLTGDDTLGYHLVNIGLHATSAFLAVLILRAAGGTGGGAGRCHLRAASDRGRVGGVDERAQEHAFGRVRAGRPSWRIWSSIVAAGGRRMSWRPPCS